MDDVLKDPRYMYPHKKFDEKNEGNVEGQNEMYPKPDCGEKSYKGNGELEGRKALITGGDSGIGRACAIAFAREGSKVCIQYHPEEEEDAKELFELLEKEGINITLLPYDFKITGNATKMVEKASAAMDGIDILVMNAGFQKSVDELSKLKIEQVEDTFKVNIISMYETIIAVEKYLEPGSSVITTTSVQGFKPSANLLDYAATKAAINNLTVNLSQYFSGKGVRVNGVAPGPIWTPIQLNEGSKEGTIPDIGHGTLLGRAGQPVELSPIYVFLASNKSSYVTGQIYGITGGDAINL